MDRDNKAADKKLCVKNSGESGWSQSTEISYRPSVIGWLCCRIIREEYQRNSKPVLFHSGFTPLAIFRDRLTALLYAYSISTPLRSDYFKRFKIFTEDGTNGFEKPPSRGARHIKISPEEREYLERLEAKICGVDHHYEGAENCSRDRAVKNKFVWVFPLKIINPPMDTISTHVKLTATIWKYINVIFDSTGIVINKCEGCDEREYARSTPSKHSRLVCEVEVEYFPFEFPFLFNSNLAERLSRSLAKCYPSVSRIEQIPIDLAQNVARFLPFELVLKLLMPDKPRTADTELELKQQIIFSLPKRVAPSLKWSNYRKWPEYRFSYPFKPNDDFWEVNAKRMRLKYTVNDIPENANWSSLVIVVNDDSEISAVRKAVSFLRSRIPAKYLSEVSKCIVEVLMIPKDNFPEGLDFLFGTTESLKLEFYTVNGLKHCLWYLFSACQSETFESDCSDCLQNSTIVFLKDASPNDKSDNGDVVINDLASHLVTASDRVMGVNRDSNQDQASLSSSAPPLSVSELSPKQLPTLYPQKVEFLLNKILLDVSTGTLRQLWTKIATLFQISNFSFINHQDQTTPVYTPTDLVVLTDYTWSHPHEYSGPSSTFFPGYWPCVRNSALSTAYRNNSGCLETLKSFDVNVTVLSIDRYGELPRGDVRQVSKYRLKMSTDRMCEIFCFDRTVTFMPTHPICYKYTRESSGSYFVDFPHANLLVLFDSLASLRHRPVQIECWDQGQGRNYPLLRNPFGFVARRCEFYDVIFYRVRDHEFYDVDSDEVEYPDPRDDSDSCSDWP